MFAYPNTENAVLVPLIFISSCTPSLSLMFLYAGSNKYSLRKALTKYSPSNKFVLKNIPSSLVELFILNKFVLDVDDINIKTFGIGLPFWSDIDILILLNFYAFIFNCIKF